MKILYVIMLFACAVAASGVDEPLTVAEQALFSRLIEQDGNTDGYPQSQRYNINEHEPAKSIIALGPRAIGPLLIYLRDGRKTKATWDGRSGSYTLTVRDVATCILRHIGGEAELKVLERQKKWMDKIWHDARDYKDKQQDWTDAERNDYIRLFEDIKDSSVITQWAIDVIKMRLSLAKDTK